jgi:hypothetical protein
MLGEACDLTGLVLAGVRIGKPNRAWCSRSFRPVYRPKASLIQQLSQPINADVFAFDCDDLGNENPSPITADSGRASNQAERAHESEGA